MANCVDTFDAVLRVAENTKAAINSFERCFFHPFLKLLIRFERLDWSLGQRLYQLPRHTEEMHQAGFAFTSRLFTAGRDVYGNAKATSCFLFPRVSRWT